MSAETQTLVLNPAYQPVGVVSWMDAITMLVTNKAEVVAEYDGFVRSQLLVIKMPAVVRLLRFFKRDKKPVKFSRVNIYARDRYTCQYCGEKKRMDELTYDHVIPRSRGGKTEWTNIVSACADCNGEKKNRTPAEAGMKLLSKPVQPKATPAIVLNLSHRSVPDAWRDYLYWTGELDQS